MSNRAGILIIDREKFDKNGYQPYAAMLAIIQFSPVEVEYTEIEGDEDSTKYIVFLGLSHRFDEVPPGDETPVYAMKPVIVGGKLVNVEVTKVEDSECQATN